MNKHNDANTIQIATQINGKHFGLSAQLQSPGEFEHLVKAIKEKNYNYTIMIMDDNLKAIWISGLEEIIPLILKK